jgi:tetratricopeptide (TPR) repeat protein/predicted Ser/Thr protein kinase
MEKQRWERIAEIYQHVCELPFEERGSFLTEVCRGDDDFRREIDSLLCQDVSCDGPLERVAQHVDSTHPHPASIGGYRILRLIGEGGMGVVYEAEQDHPRRIVALKVLKSALAGPELKRRFALESEALGRLQHPGVARIYEAGFAETEFGPQPYIAMEFIRGPSLLDHANQKRLNTGARLELMIRIAEAVEHAHQRGIIHRDLKPANILVDDAGQPKILDFGVARITDADANATRQTSLGDLVGTLAYMSPEQFLGDPSLIDQRSDVYSLGVIFYELLAERPPYNLSRQLPEAARIVQEQDPPFLGAHKKEFRGDLETIAAKSLQKERSARYASAAELAADIRRYLALEPILAKPPTAIYQARKFIARHRVLVSAVLVVFVVLLGGIAASTAEAIRAARERDRALRAEQVASAVNDFLQNDLLAQASARAQAGARTAPDPDLKVRTALDRAAARIPGKFDFQPVVEASIRRTIGLAYFDMNLLSEAQPQLERAADIRKRVLGAQHPDTLTSLDELGGLYNLQGKYPEAEKLLAEVLAARRRVLGEQDRGTLATMSNFALAVSYEGDDARAAPILADVLHAFRRLLGDQHPDTLSVMDSLATTYLRLGRFAEGVSLLERELELKMHLMGAEHPNTINCMHNLATGYRSLGRFARADSLFLTAWKARRKALGGDHWETQNTRYSLGISYRAQGRYAEAEKLFKESAATLARGLGPEHPLTLKVLHNLGEMYRLQQRLDEAESIFNLVLEARRRTLGSENPATAQVLASLGEMRVEHKAYAQAESLLSEALRIREVKTPDAWERYYTQCILGMARAGLGRLDEASALLSAGYEGMLQRQNTMPVEYRFALDRVAQWKAQVR